MTTLSAIVSKNAMPAFGGMRYGYAYGRSIETTRFENLPASILAHVCPQDSWNQSKRGEAPPST